MPVPDDLPFQDCLPLVQNDTTVDPFDATGMIDVVADEYTHVRSILRPFAPVSPRSAAPVHYPVKKGRKKEGEV